MHLRHMQNTDIYNVDDMKETCTLSSAAFYQLLEYRNNLFYALATNRCRKHCVIGLSVRLSICACIQKVYGDSILF